MKLNEIFDTENREIDKSENDKEIGKGSFSNVYNNKHDPHMVNKFPNELYNDNKYEQDDQDDADGYWIYANAVVKSGIWKENPAFPRIYIKGNKSLTMEKLFSDEDIDLEYLESYLENNFSTTPLDYYNIKGYSSKNEYVVDKMTTALYMGYRGYDTIKDSNLKKAMQWIKELSSKNHIRLDLHPGNVMFRRGSYGIQLVIVDPVY